jgi:hypothetical protein
MIIRASFEHVAITSGIAVLVAFVCAMTMRNFTPIGGPAWEFGVSAISPIRGLIVGWTVLALILAALQRHSLSKLFWTIGWINSAVSVLAILAALGGRVAA